jgi:hypothetical protein
MQRVRDAAGEDADEPRGNHGEEDGQAPERQPQCQRDEQQQPEEDRQAAAHEVVGDDQVDRMSLLRDPHVELLCHDASFRGARSLSPL